MTKLKPSRQRHQVKSRWYYIFWGTATLSVFVGQIYVGSGYRQMSKAFNRIIDTTLKVIEPRPRGYYAPLVPPPQSSDFTFNEQEMVIK
jgi:hypothetical protein|tara:strand:- start:243 stop:509 length:267 start_codon:yes stop_codon:yes gene_type:complete